MTVANPIRTTAAQASSGARIVAADGRELVLQAMSLDADACAGLVRVTVTQVFHNPFDEPLAATCLLPLPLEAAVSGFRFVVGDDTVTGEIDRRDAARQRFEEAIVVGRTAALLEQERSTLFQQQVGNIPPRTGVTATIVLDQRLRWLDDGWEWRFPVAIGPRYLGAPGRVADAARIEATIADAPLAARLQLRLAIGDRVLAGGATSPSHDVGATRLPECMHVTFRDGPVRLDRDVVVRWPVAVAGAEVLVDAARPAAGHRCAAEAHALLTITPPAGATRARPLPRDLIVLLDTSGSMSGAPLAQAKAVVRALIGSLDDTDRLELIEFSDRPRPFAPEPRAAGVCRAAALRWLDALAAGGGTEMLAGVRAALASLRAGAQPQLGRVTAGQVVLVTDGQVGFEGEVVRETWQRLPAASRLHTVGIGSATNRSLLAPAARAGRGIDIVVGLDEDPAEAAARLVAALRQPLVVDLRIGGDALVRTAPLRLPDLFAGRPAVVAAGLHPAGGRLVVEGRTVDGTWRRTVTVPALEPGDGRAAVSLLYARETVEDLEMQRLLEHGKQVDRDIEGIGLAFGIATRLTSWVAVSERATVDPRQPTRRVVVPGELPYGASIGAFALRVASPVASLACMSVHDQDPSLVYRVSPAPADAYRSRRSPSQLHQLDSRPPPARRDLAEVRDRLARAQAVVTATGHRIAEADARLEQAREAVRDVQREVEVLRLEFDEAEARLQRLRTELTGLVASRDETDDSFDEGDADDDGDGDVDDGIDDLDAIDATTVAALTRVIARNRNLGADDARTGALARWRALDGEARDALRSDPRIVSAAAEIASERAVAAEHADATSGGQGGQPPVRPGTVLLDADVAVDDARRIVLRILPCADGPAPAQVAWRPEPEATVVVDGGMRRVVPVDTGLTTRGGMLASDLDIRLVLGPVPGRVTRVLLGDHTEIRVRRG